MIFQMTPALQQFPNTRATLNPAKEPRGEQGRGAYRQEAAMPKIHSVSPPVLRRPAKASVEIHRELGWIEISWSAEHLHEADVYWARPCVIHRWRRFEIKRRAFVLGPLTISVRRQEEPVLRSIDGGQSE